MAAEILGQREAVIQEEFDARYLDVKLLMKNYRMLKAHYAHVLPETLEVNAICSMRRKTGLMMSHVNKMLTAYHAICYGLVCRTKRTAGIRCTCDISTMSVSPSTVLRADSVLTGALTSATSTEQWRTWLCSYSALKR